MGCSLMTWIGEHPRDKFVWFLGESAGMVLCGLKKFFLQNVLFLWARENERLRDRFVWL